MTLKKTSRAGLLALALGVLLGLFLSVASFDASYAQAPAPGAAPAPAAAAPATPPAPPPQNAGSGCSPFVSTLRGTRLPSGGGATVGSRRPAHTSILRDRPEDLRAHP